MSRPKGNKTLNEARLMVMETLRSRLDHYPPSPEEELWINVIGQAVHDAYGYIPDKVTTGELRHAAEALSFLNGEGLIRICNMIGLSPSWTRNAIREPMVQVRRMIFGKRSAVAQVELDFGPMGRMPRRLA